MLGMGAPVGERAAGRVRVRPPVGLCLIRSGQDWTDTDGDERGAAMRYLSTLGPAARLRLYHEVSVLPADGQLFEYVDRRPGTGLMM